MDVLIKSKCMNPVIYFDELDKVSETPKGEEINNLLTGTPPKRDDGDGGKKAAKASSSVPSTGHPKAGGAGGMEPQPQA